MALKFGFHCLKSVIHPRNRISIRRYCIGVNNSVDKKHENSDEFGTYELSIDEKHEYDKFDFVPEDMDSQDKHEAIIADIYRPGREQYLRKLNYLIHEKKDLRGALNTLEVEMKEQCVKPEQPHFRLLINACSQVGHVRKAFKLHSELKARGLKKHVGIYADLFHACTNCHDKPLALNKATYLRKKLAEDHFIPNPILYHTMIQAFGRCGDLETAFELIDEMRQYKVPVTSETFAFLLQGCVSDKQNGFRHALLTWRTMRKKQIWPKLFTYNLMLKAAQDCGLGDIKYTGDIIQACLTVEKQIEYEKTKHKSLEAQKRKSKGLLEQKDDYEGPSQQRLDVLTIISPEDKNKELGIVPLKEMPNLLAKRPDVEGIVGLAPSDTPQNRLMLMGGQTGFIEWMMRDRVEPDIKTLDQMLRLIPNTNEAEAELLSAMSKLNIKPDINFCNQLIIQREQRQELDLAKSTMQMMTQHDLSPDIMTFGSLARCCKDPKAVRSFLEDCEDVGLRINKEILTTLILNMCKAHKPKSVGKLLNLCLRKQIQPDKKMIETVENFYQIYRGFLLRKEKGGYVPYAVVLEIKNYNLSNWENFVSIYKEWLAKVKPDLNEDPLLQFETIKDQQIKSNS